MNAFRPYSLNREPAQWVFERLTTHPSGDVVFRSVPYSVFDVLELMFRDSISPHSLADLESLTDFFYGLDGLDARASQMLRRQVESEVTDALRDKVSFIGPAAYWSIDRQDPAIDQLVKDTTTERLRTFRTTPRKD